MRLASACLALLACLASGPAFAEPPRVAIIIDDLGYHMEAGRRAIALPGPLAFAVLPGTPGGRRLAEAAHDSGKEVLLHLPLQSVDHNGTPEPGGIMLDMTRKALTTTFDDAIRSVPHAIGINTHRGSLVTRHPGHMRWLMDAIRERETLFFVDSFTTHESVAMQVARETGVKAVRRDVFLDPDRQPDTVAHEFERMKRLARKRGHAVAIAHPYPATLEFLERELPGLAADGIELVPISHLLQSSGE